MAHVLNKVVEGIMTKNLHELAKLIDPRPELYNAFQKWAPDCLLRSQSDRMQTSHPDKYTKASKLVEFMMHRTNDEFIGFCKALIEDGQDHVVKGYFTKCLDLLGTSYNALHEEVRPSQADTSRGASAAPGSAHPADPPQGYDAEKMHLDVTDDHYKVQVTNSTKKFYQEKCEQAYRMDTEKRGFALVINVNKVKGEEERTGTDIDRNKIVLLLKQLDFEPPTVYDDDDGLTHEEILKKVKAFAMTVHKDARRVAVFILSHGGKEDVICGTDGKTVAVQELVDAVNHEDLTGIPKMVVFQACRGGYKEKVQKDNSGPPDLITCYATKKDFVSYRDPNDGSWFIAAIVQIFEKHAHEFEIRKLMDMVQIKVGEQKTDGKCQTTETVHNLQREWFLFPGYPEF